MKTCSVCRESKDESLFETQKIKGAIYIRPQCKSCGVKRVKAYRKTPAGITSRKKERIKRYQAQRAAYKSIKSQQSCIMCGEDEPCCLDFHHLKPASKRRILVDLVWTSFTRLKEEICKCVCLCANCHRKLHAGKIALPLGTKPLSREWVEQCSEKARLQANLPAKPKTIKLTEAAYA